MAKMRKAPPLNISSHPCLSWRDENLSEIKGWGEKVWRRPWAGPKNSPSYPWQALHGHWPSKVIWPDHRQRKSNKISKALGPEVIPSSASLHSRKKMALAKHNDVTEITTTFKEHILQKLGEGQVTVLQDVISINHNHSIHEVNKAQTAWPQKTLLNCHVPIYWGLCFGYGPSSQGKPLKVEGENDNVPLKTQVQQVRHPSTNGNLTKSRVPERVSLSCKTGQSNSWSKPLDWDLERPPWDWLKKTCSLSDKVKTEVIASIMTLVRIMIYMGENSEKQIHIPGTYSKLEASSKIVFCPELISNPSSKVFVYFYSAAWVSKDWKHSDWDFTNPKL